MKKNMKRLNIILLIVIAIFAAYTLIKHDASASITKAMRKHYYVGYVNKKAEYLYFGENDQVGVGTMVKGEFVMTAHYKYKVTKNKDNYILSFNKKKYRIQKNDDNLPERLFGINTAVNYTLKDG